MFVKVCKIFLTSFNLSVATLTTKHQILINYIAWPLKDRKI